MKNTNKEFSPLNIILIRHASVIMNGSYDLLTDLGKEYSKNLPQILKDEGYGEIDFIYYVNIDKEGKVIERCNNTLKYLHFENKEPIKWNESPDLNLKKFSGKTIIICYMKKLLDCLPDVLIDKINLPKGSKMASHKLYENIIVFNYSGGNLLMKEIKTGDKSYDNQN